MTALSLVEANDGWGPTAVPGTATDEDLAALRDKQEKTPAVTEKERSSSGQLRMAYRLAAKYSGRILYVADLKRWHVWDGQRWAEDVTGRCHEYVREVLHDAFDEGMHDSELRQAVRACQSANAIDGILRLAESMQELVVTSEDLDADPYLVNTPNGTYDLRTNTVRPHDPADRLTKMTRGEFAPEVVYGGDDVPLWHRFLEQVLPDEAVRRYFRAFVGMALCGAVREQLFTIATGTGANGKGVAYGSILNALGDYGHASDSELFMSGKPGANAASPALFDLMGRRFVVVSETEQDRPLATALMKQLTGGDPITARQLYSQPVTFKPTHTPLMITNHLPRVSGADSAAWRRIRVIPFDVTVPPEERDPELGAKLEAEADVIVTWALEGWADYQQNGMPDAAAVTAATGQYRRGSDTVARFLAERCVRTPAGRTPLSDLYREFQSWAVDDGADVLARRQFSEQLESHGFEKYRNKAGMAFRGVGLLVEESA
jgi:poxvirus D5 protein-like